MLRLNPNQISILREKEGVFTILNTDAINLAKLGYVETKELPLGRLSWSITKKGEDVLAESSSPPAFSDNPSGQPFSAAQQTQFGHRYPTVQLRYS